MTAEAFKAAFLPLHAKLYRIAYRLMENQTDAEDMVQELYIKLWQRRAEWDGIENAESFAVTVLKHLCIDQLRAAHISTETLREGMAIVDEQRPSTVESSDQLAWVEHIVGLLPRNEQTVIRLKHWGELSDKEIEQITGLKSGHIRVLLSRARKNIITLSHKWSIR